MEDIKIRYGWLDCLRAIAVLLVIFQHYFYDRFFINDSPSPFVEYFRIINFGKVGVVIFFFVSGFIIPRSLFSESHSPIKTFAISRFFRLYPAYWLSVIFAASLSSQLGTKNFFINLTMLQQFVGSPNLIGVYWTLQIELIFYFICAVLFYFQQLQQPQTARKMFFSLLFIALMFAIARGFSGHAIPVALPLCLAVMFLGTIFYWCSEKNQLSFPKFLIYTVFLTIFLIPISFFAYRKDTGFGECWYGYIMSYTIGVVMTIALSTRYKIQSSHFMFIGRISYSIYLFHSIFKISFFQSAWLNALSSLVVTALFSTLCYYLIEKPGQKLGAHLKKYLRTPKVRDMASHYQGN
ncbi:MAG TPA: acyltransferase [Gammaproteobacteria bacterium]|jgi:peptidoglycan/LPS O-acetylase OafA/YrhL|nr:acyltransferase [Gammaproteobacteria bacterium]